MRNGQEQMEAATDVNRSEIEEPNSRRVRNQPLTSGSGSGRRHRKGEYEYVEERVETSERYGQSVLECLFPRLPWASLNDVTDLKHVLLTFNETQMHKIGTYGKRNSPSLCFAAA
jgi:hypothetical protein